MTPVYTKCLLSIGYGKINIVNVDPALDKKIRHKLPSFTHISGYLIKFTTKKI